MFAMQLGQSYDAQRKRTPEETFFKVYTFNSARKSMSTVLKTDNGGYRLMSKGASEVILKKCIKIHGSGANIVEFTQADGKPNHN
jgi:Ca2+ transporting ATPase